MNLYESQFEESLDASEAYPPRKTVLIASTPRCGSHMLGHAMTATGRLGMPFEYANPANMSEWMRRLDTATPEMTLARLIEKRTTPNGVFAIKAHFEHGVVFGEMAHLINALPGELTVVHLRRADVLRQAVSFAVAKQTGVWIRGQEPDGQTPRYDRDLVAHCLNEVAVQNALWTSFFDEAGIEPIEMMYENVASDVPAAVTQVAAAAGILAEGEVLRAEAVTARQSRKSRTEDWIAQYTSDRNDTPTLLRRVARRMLG